jgi:nucleoside-diphosphate-sugar epimerase
LAARTLPFARAVVTGASGFIGAHLARALHAAGVEATLLVRAASSTSRLTSLLGPALDEVALRVVDLSSDAEVARALADARPDVVFHLAGDARPSAPDSEGARMTALHVEATVRIAEAALRARTRRVVTLSTSDVYGLLPSPHEPEAAEDPRSAYARSKAQGDAELRRLYAERGLDVVILRPYHVYGLYQPERAFVAMLIDACEQDRPFPMTDGQQRRDFVHVSDVVDALLAAAGAPRALAGRTLDICTGVATPLALVAALVRRELGCERGGPVLGALPRRALEPDEHYGAPERTEALLGWRPRIALDEGLRDLLAQRREERR